MVAQNTGVSKSEFLEGDVIVWLFLARQNCHLIYIIKFRGSLSCIVRCPFFRFKIEACTLAVVSACHVCSETKELFRTLHVWISYHEMDDVYCTYNATVYSFTTLFCVCFFIFFIKLLSFLSDLNNKWNCPSEYGQSTWRTDGNRRAFIPIMTAHALLKL